jgi:hypothetical protein
LYRNHTVRAVPTAFADSGKKTNMVSWSRRDQGVRTMTIEEAVLEKLRALPEDKKAEVLRYVEHVEAETRRQQLPRTASDRASAAMRWISEHRAEYTGLWVALDGDRLVTSGDDAKAVYDTARREGVEVPFLHQVEPEEEGAFWGGWL